MIFRMLSNICLCAVLLVITGCQKVWELDPVDFPALAECRNFGTDGLVIKQEAKLMMFGYTNSQIIRLSERTLPDAPQGAGTSQLTVVVHYDSVDNETKVTVDTFPGFNAMKPYLRRIARDWTAQLQFTDFIKDVAFFVKILPSGILDIKYYGLSVDKASNPSRTCYTIPLSKMEAQYLLPLDYSPGKIQWRNDKMPAKNEVRAYAKIRRRFKSQFAGSGPLTRIGR